MPGPERRLAAIVSADIAGYSRLMAEDEDATIQMVTARRQQVGLLLEQHRGRLVDFTGDNFLAEFASAVDAVECAVEIQRVGVALNADLPPARKMKFRIGIHLGEIQVQDDRIFGTGVNIAARLETLAEPGGVCISAKVHEEVSGRTRFSFRNIGEQRVKNIPERVHAYAVDVPEVSAPAVPRGRHALPIAVALVALVVLVGAAWWLWPGLMLPAASSTSLIVLVPQDLSPERDQEHFTIGMTDEIINRLVKVPGLDVMGLTTSLAVKRNAWDIAEIGRELGVENVIEGSVRRFGDGLRITMQLIAVDDGFHLWSEQFDRPVGDVFAVQEDIAQAVAGAFEAVLADPDVPKPTENIEAYELYAAGRHVANLRTEEGLRNGIEYYEQALALDPGYAPAHAGLSFATSQLWNWNYDLREGTREVAREAADRALALDGSLAEAHLALAISLAHEHDRFGWERELRRSLELSPGLAAAHHQFGNYLLSTGRVQDALARLERAIELDPLSPAITFNASWAYLDASTATLPDLRVEPEVADRYRARAIDLGERSIALFPGQPAMRLLLAQAYELDGRSDDAWETFSGEGLPPGLEAPLAEAMSTGGIRAAMATVAAIQASQTEGPCAGANIYLFPWAGDMDRAIECLDASYRAHSIPIPFHHWPAYWDPVRDDPRFQAILEGMGLAD